MQKEREKLLAKVLRTLTAHEQQLFALWRQGWKAKVIADTLEIDVASVYHEKSLLKKELEKLIKEAQERK